MPSSVRVKVTWAELEPVRGTFSWGLIDKWLSTYPPSTTVTVRLFAGTSTPSWVNSIVGPCVRAVSSYNRQALCVPRYWTDSFLDLYQQLVQAIGDRYDGNPRVLMVSNAACTTAWSEPFIKGGPTVGAALAAAGDSEAGEYHCMERSMADQAAAMPHTRIDLGDNVGWQIPKPGGIESSWPKERDLMDAFRATYGGQFVPNYHGMASQTSTYSGSPSAAPDLFSWMKVAGGPSNVQRGCQRKLGSASCNDAFVIPYAIALNVCQFELTSNGSDLSTQQIAAFSAQLAACPGH